jgi:hypothetical protein
MRRLSVRGASLVEALVAVALGAVAAGTLAASAAVGVRALSLAGGVGAQVMATHDALERLRLGGPDDTSDVVGRQPAIARRRLAIDGRGRADALAVTSTWAEGHRLDVRSEYWR